MKEEYYSKPYTRKKYQEFTCDDILRVFCLLPYESALQLYYDLKKEVSLGIFSKEDFFAIENDSKIKVYIKECVFWHIRNILAKKY